MTTTPATAYEIEVLNQILIPDLEKLWDVEEYLRTVDALIERGLVKRAPVTPGPSSRKLLVTDEGLYAVLGL